MSGEEELALQKEEEELERREVVSPGFHIVKQLDEELDDNTDKETE
jgi:hypothetical protein